MKSLDFLCLSPLIIIAAAPVILMLVITLVRNFKLAYWFSLFAYMAAFSSLYAVMPHVTHAIEPLLMIDGFSVLFMGIIILSAIIITVLSYDYLRERSGDREEYFIILFIAVLGACILVMSEHFVSFFLGLETLSISLYILISYIRTRETCIEAGAKFLVIASLSTAFLLFGMGLIYAETGKMNFRDIFSIQWESGFLSPILLAGFGLSLAGIGFKLALVPFHMWTPDIYQGAPVPVTAFVATVSKGAVLALALRLYADTSAHDSDSLSAVTTVVAVVTMTAGNILALMQTNLKRLLAYSSIAHVGYMLIAVIAGTPNGVEAAVFYIGAYTITILGAFGVISVLSSATRDADRIGDVGGLFWTNPLIASVLAISLLSLAGLPLTAGFISKFYLVLAGAREGLWLLAFSLVINSVISLYYYLRVIRAMFTTGTEERKVKMSVTVKLALTAIAIGIVMLGIIPSYLTDLIKTYSAVN